jgi:transcription initiation factor TFIIIB Brf1 subunit/transcription initiation factor TFIIB
MEVPTTTVTDLSHVPALLAALQSAQERITLLEHERDQLRLECGELRQEMRWIDQLLAVPATVMSPSHKVTLRAVVKEIQSHTPDARGLVEIKSWELCQTVGQSKDTFLANLTYCTEQLGILRKQVERPGRAQGDFSANYFIGVTDRLAHPHTYTVSTPRQHGGLREVCPHCHSERLKKKVTVTCQDCGAVLRESSSDVNTDATGNLTTDTNQDTQRQVDDGYPQPEQEPATPPCAGSDETGIPQAENDDQAQDQYDQGQGEPCNQADIMTAAARLLVEIAGPEPVHIEMSPRGPKKYYDVHRAITKQDIRAHLKGWKTKGAYLRHPGSMTRALCYDADTPKDWQKLQTAARFLTYGDFCPLLEPSPVQDDEHTGGGHLWIIFTDLVKATWAHQRALQYAPTLREIKESWPGTGPNKVRLPGGKYVKPGFAQWCNLSDAHGKTIATDGQGAARVLLVYQTPAEIVPEYPEPEDVGQCSCPEPSPNTDHQVNACSAQNGTKICYEMQPGVDQHWQHKYNHHLWFYFTPAQLAAWYNERHKGEDMLPLEKNGMGLASWRGERTASVGLREDGWVDFGASARRSDGKQDGGDALELTVRVGDEPKPEVMRRIARQLVSEARAALENAAHCGEQPPQWVQVFMSPAGWEQYHQLREEASQSDQAITAIPEPAPHTRGLAGLYPPGNDAPDSHVHNGQGQRQLRELAQAVLLEANRTRGIVEAFATEPVGMYELEMIRDYGRAQEWAALVIDCEEIIPAGRAHWLDFVWLSHKKDQQHRVYECIRGRSQLS